MHFLFTWLISALAIAITAYVLPGVALSGFVSALLTAVVLGLVNALIRPVLFLLTLPLTILSLGIFILVLNALLIMLTSAIVPGFSVRGFWDALLFSVILTVVHYLLNLIPH